jgi:hypothetical protein
MQSAIVFPFSIPFVVFLPPSAPMFKAFYISDAVSINVTLVLDHPRQQNAFRADIISAVATTSFSVNHCLSFLINLRIFIFNPCFPKSFWEIRK